MKKYTKISKFNFTTEHLNDVIRIELDSEASQQVIVNNDSRTYLFTIADTKAPTLIKVASQVSDVIRRIKSFKLELDGDFDYQFLIENLLLALTDVNLFKQTYQSPHTYLVQTSSDIEAVYTLALARAEGYNLTRILNHLPFSICNSDSLSNEIENLLDDQRFKITIYREQECKDLNLNGVLAVSQAAKYQPAVIKVEYQTANTPKIGLIGKGIMFDCGGYNLKTGDFSSMKTDMAGCSAVIGCLKTVANLNLEANLVAYLMTTENLINENALVPGDIITYRNQVSVEITNTDAEGRLVLADGLLLVETENCDTVIDIATLTGNSAASLGKGLAPLYSTNQAVTDHFIKLNYTSSDNIWPMPMPDEYLPLIEGNITDLRNTSSTKHAGSICAALFLKHFAPANANWVHIDMGAMSRKEEYGAPVNGYGVRLLTNFVQSYSNKINK